MFVDPQTSFLIYGTGGDGIHTLRTLSEAGVNVIGFLDKRAAEMDNFKGLPVYTAESAATHDHLLDAVVVVTVKNVFIHSEIAELLRNLGFHKAIFKPLGLLKGGGSDAERLVDGIYDELVALRRWPQGSSPLPDIPKRDKLRFEDRLAISKTDVSVNVWIPSELVFNYRRQDVVFSNCNMPLFFPLVGLYRGLLAQPDIHFDWTDAFLVYSSDWLARNDLAMTDGQRHSLLQSRVAVFQEMERLFEVDLDFFRRNAPVVEMSSAGHFNVTASGRNRIAFLLARGFRFLPLTVPIADYDAWLAPERVRSLMEYLWREETLHLFAPIPHPLFADVPSAFVDYARLFLIPVAERLLRGCYEKYIQRKNGLRLFADAPVKAEIATRGIACLLRDGGAAARYFSSLGYPVTRLIDAQWRGEQELTECIDRLFGFDIAHHLHKCDVVLLDSSASPELSEQLARNATIFYFLQRYEQAVPAFLQTDDFHETHPLFDTLCLNGRIVCRIFGRRK